ncbi:hypothetical protein [Streptomyces sp. NPDC057509]|uniref:hypothetical protein n=1 Tax=Streptomyces sp. NPDC057509 TaxID=3346152 RepID=UPI0036920B30
MRRLGRGLVRPSARRAEEIGGLFVRTGVGDKARVPERGATAVREWGGVGRRRIAHQRRRTDPDPPCAAGERHPVTGRDTRGGTL